MFSQFWMKSGNNNLLFQASIWDYLDDKSIRYFKNGASTVRGIPSYSYSHKPTAANATLGLVDFSVVNQPLVYWQFNPALNSGVRAWQATIGSWATQDIGFSSNLVISHVVFTYNNVDATNYDFIRAIETFNCSVLTISRSLQLSQGLLLVSCLSLLQLSRMLTNTNGGRCSSSAA